MKTQRQGLINQHSPRHFMKRATFNSQMDKSQMDNSQMDNSQMDKSQMDLNDLFNSIIKYNLEEETPVIVYKNISRFLNKTTNKKMQSYNNFSDMITLSQIWTIIRKKQYGDLGVKFIKKVMTIEKDDPYKNKFMMGFANNSERTLGNLSFLRESGGASIANKILNTYTNHDKRPLFPDYM